jgi:CRP-like cAMP-binding protein
MGNILMKHRMTLWQSSFFSGISEADIDKLLGCLGGGRKTFAKSSFILTVGDECKSIGILLSGALHILRDDFWGNRRIMEQVTPGEQFGAAFVCAGIKQISVSVLAVEKSEVLFLDYGKVVSSCARACPFHTQMIKNLVRGLAEKNNALLAKNTLYTLRNTREKLLSYLSAEAQKAKSPVFEIPFNRDEMAAYLSVDRSAMSAELGRMRDDGILKFRKNRFELLSIKIRRSFS